MAHPRILVCGLLPVQNRKINERFGRRGDLRFITTDSSANVWGRVGASNFDQIFLNTKFISHKHQDQLPREKITYVNGSMSQMCRVLDEYLPAHFVQPPAVAASMTPETSKEEPVMTETKPPVAHRVFEHASQLAEGVTLQPSSLAKELNEDADTVSVSLARMHTTGYLVRPKRGHYVTIAKTRAAMELIGKRRNRPVTTKRRTSQDPIKAVEDAVLVLMSAVDQLRKMPPKADLTATPTKALWAELARRNAK